MPGYIEVVTATWTNPKTGARATRITRYAVTYNGGGDYGEDWSELIDTDPQEIDYEGRTITPDWPTAFDALTEMLDKHGRETSRRED
jgi:hypothetical protein